MLYHETCMVVLVARHPAFKLQISHSVVACCPAPQTKIFESGTKDEMCIFDDFSIVRSPQLVLKPLKITSNIRTYLLFSLPKSSFGGHKPWISITSACPIVCSPNEDFGKLNKRRYAQCFSMVWEPVVGNSVFDLDESTTGLGNVMRTFWSHLPGLGNVMRTFWCHLPGVIVQTTRQSLVSRNVVWNVGD